MTIKPALIWSNYHGMWWKPNAAGYTYDIFKAGIYDEAEAITRVLGQEGKDAVASITRLLDAIDEEELKVAEARERLKEFTDDT